MSISVSCSQLQRAETDLAWAGGLFEGEGSFYSTANGYRLTASLVSTDYDIIIRFKYIMGYGSMWSEPAGKSGRLKVAYRWVADGDASFRETYDLLKPWLGMRRRRTAEALLERRERIIAHVTAERVCVMCLQPYSPAFRANGKSLYCSRACSAKAWRERHKGLAA